MALPVALYVFDLKPSPLGWGVLSVVAGACFAFAVRDALKARGRRRTLPRA